MWWGLWGGEPVALRVFSCKFAQVWVQGDVVFSISFAAYKDFLCAQVDVAALNLRDLMNAKARVGREEDFVARGFC